ncbi:AT-hook motif nuclear-localized protein 14-like [Olea europaea var. sylvestris]|uniref:AT-hook motif nuclear-localized protein 14-like n=1 Tax=Olea europaea var. sylvestris TaxID=158386 RepID=UPI000C1CD5C3|nr:AT-hook motif nuclear-localized protein 14-like [Olea europaea var. sylvestris]
MEPNNDSSGLSSYFLHQLHGQSPPPPPTSAAPGNLLPANGVVPNSTTTTNMAYLHSVPSAVSSPLETVKRKRGRPRKYGTPEQAAAAKRMSGSSVPKKRDNQDLTAAAAAGSSGSYSYHSKKSQLAALGNIGQGFTPHIINIVAGEDVGQKILMFMQHSKREMCIISASGSVSNASLRQPSTSGGTVTYEGRFDILSLSGSYMCTELGGRTGGLSVCLASTDGQIIGGGVGGPLTAAGPIQVIVGTFLIDTKKDMTGEAKVDATASKLPSPIRGGASVPGVSFRTPFDSSNRNVIGNQFVIHQRNMQFTPSDSMDWRGKTGHGALNSPENGDYEHIPE